MSLTVTTLRDLYISKKINDETIQRLFDESKISSEEYEYIKGGSE